MITIKELELPAKLENLNPFMDFISNLAENSGFSAKRINDINLAIEEILVNVFNYAYGNGEGIVKAICSIDDTRFIIEIIDKGSPFNPLVMADPNISEDVEDRKIGGLGIYFVKNLMDEVYYKNIDNKNILTLIIKK
ncbi:MAG: ATP-binding protein [Desulfobacterales bacterium]|nr:ATP-binding protein [Desulfobacterales bacterium]